MGDRHVTQHHTGDGKVTRVTTQNTGDGGTKTTVSRGSSGPITGNMDGGKIVSETRTDRHGNSYTKNK
jgi:hypothetical protein